MLFVQLKILGLDRISYPPQIIVKRLNAIGFVQNVRIDLKEKTISFEYGSHRDRDSAMCELRKMGLICNPMGIGQKGSQKRTSENHV
jgi:hypothetical protein